jgi:glycosyltransferase involved in cell wall biosynthesis
MIKCREKLEMNTLKLSIIIPCYNCEKTLREAVESCFTQGFAQNEYEIILVNDGSTDSTPQLCEALAREHSHIRVIHHDSNRGGGAARNTAATAAHAPVIFCLDSDDMLGHTPSLRLMHTHLNEHGLDGVCFETISSFADTEPGNIIRTTVFPTHKTYELEDLIERTAMCGLYTVFMFTKEAFLKTGGYPTHHGFDTQGFAWRFLGCGLKAQSCPGTEYRHRVFTESYYIREYKAGKTNINFKCVILEHTDLLQDEVRDVLVRTDVRDFTKPLMNTLKKFPRVFNADAALRSRQRNHTAFTITYPALSAIPITSPRGIWYRICHKLRKLWQAPV